MRTIEAKNSQGFTLIEITTVIIIIGIVASLALPRFTGTFERMRASEGVQMLTALLGAQKTFQFENNGNYADTTAELDVTIDRSENFDLPGDADINDPVNPVTTAIARIRRTNAYRLEISEEGSVRCVDVPPSDFTCAQAGIPTAF